MNPWDVAEVVMYGPAVILKCECGKVFRGLEARPEECPNCQGIRVRSYGRWPEGCLVVEDEKVGSTV